MSYFNHATMMHFRLGRWGRNPLRDPAQKQAEDLFHAREEAEYRLKKAGAARERRMAKGQVDDARDQDKTGRVADACHPSVTRVLGEA